MPRSGNNYTYRVALAALAVTCGYFLIWLIGDSLDEQQLASLPVNDLSIEQVKQQPSREVDRRSPLPIDSNFPSLNGQPARASTSDRLPAPGADSERSEQDWATKYVHHELDQLEGAIRTLQRQQEEIAEPILDERLMQGKARIVGPVSRDERYSVGWIGEYPRLNQPTVLVTSEEVTGDQRIFKIVELYPHEVPEFQMLREEEVWVRDLLKELQGAWREDDP